MAVNRRKQVARLLERSVKLARELRDAKLHPTVFIHCSSEEDMQVVRDYMDKLGLSFCEDNPSGYYLSEQMYSHGGPFRCFSKKEGKQ